MTATLLPNAKQQFLDSNGRPLAGGSLYFYIPNTSTLKNTWQDAGKTVLNTNPVVLDANGQAIIYGDGQYRQVVYDVHGNLIWDKLTDSYALNSEFQSFLTGIESSSGAAMIGSLGSITGEVPRSVQAALQDIVSFGRFGCVGDGVEITKNNTAWQAVVAYINNFPSTTFAPIGIYIPDGTYKYSYTPVFTRPVRIFGDGGAILNYVGTTEVLVMGNKAQTSALPGTNDYYEVDNICFTGAASATYGLYFANWVLQPKVTNCRFLNFGSANMYALTFQGNNWSIDVLNNRYLCTDAPGYARHWCQVLGVSNTASAGTVSAGQVVNGNYDGSNSRLNALNNWVRFGGGAPGNGYITTGTKSRIVGGGVENHAVGVLCDGTGISLFDPEIALYFEAQYGTACIQAAGTVSGLSVHDCYANMHNDDSYNSDARFFMNRDANTRVSSAVWRDLTILNASKHPLVTLADAANQYANYFNGKILTNAPMLCALGDNYSINYDGYQPSYHNPDLLGSLDTSVTTITTSPTRISSRVRVSAGSNLSASVAAVTAPGAGVPPCRNEHFSLTWSSTLAGGNYIAMETRLDDLANFSGSIATAGLIARYVNSGGASSISAVLQIATYVGGVSTIIASKNITLTNQFQGFSLPQVVSAVKGSDADFISINLVVQGAGHTGSSALEVLNIDASTDEFPPPLIPVDRPRQVSTANQWWRKISNSMSQSSAITWIPVQIGNGWANTVRNIRQISLAGATSATITAFGDSSVVIQPTPSTGTFDVVFSVEAES